MVNSLFHPLPVTDMHSRGGLKAERGVGNSLFRPLPEGVKGGNGKQLAQTVTCSGNSGQK
jgi:hypothetical protein